MDVESFTWSKPTVNGEPPSARVGHACCLTKDNVLFLFGGFVRKTGYMFDVHALGVANWQWEQVRASMHLHSG